MKIGTLNIKGKVFLAPMCDVTSLPFRLICKQYGAAVVYSEMINADAFVMSSEKTEKRALFLEQERPVGIQLSGSNISVLEKAAQKAEKNLKPDLIDINFGCPAYNVMKTGSGAAALKDVQFLEKLVSTLSQSISIPLTCKMRILSNNKDTIKAAKTIEKAGAKALTVHGRTAKQRYSGKANWDIIKEVKQKLSIPVILNGDVIDEQTAQNAFSYTKCDAIMIGRAAIGNPFLFKRINHYLLTGNVLKEQALKDKIKDFNEFIKIFKKYDYQHVTSVKMLAQNFIKGIKGSKEMRKKIVQLKNIDDIAQFMKTLA